MKKAIASCRVSTPEQRLNHSLSRQEENIIKAAKELGVIIPHDGWWKGDVSSKTGNNIKRKDLQEMLQYCEKHRDVKYLILDELDRFMRSLDEFFYFEVMFKKLGVKLHFASEPELNTKSDATSKLMRALTAFRAEGSNQERQHKSISGQEKAIRDGRWPFHPKPGYMRSLKPGIHSPYTTEFEPLKRALKDIAHGRRTLLEARMELNESSYTLTKSPLKSDKFKKYICDPYYAGIIVMDRQVKGYNTEGLHEPMITLEEHQAILSAVNNTPVVYPGVRKNYNHGYPLGNITYCAGCLAQSPRTGKLVGLRHANGKGKEYFKYKCRTCNKTILREMAHDMLSDYLGQLTLDGSKEQVFLSALRAVWKQHQAAQLRTVDRLQKQRDELVEERGKLIDSMALHKELADEIKERIKSKNEALESLDLEITQASNIHEDLAEFIKFALSYIESLKDNFWELEPVQQQACLELLFPLGIGIQKDKKVYTPEISSIYSVIQTKSSPKAASKSLMVRVTGL